MLVVMTLVVSCRRYRGRTRLKSLLRTLNFEFSDTLSGNIQSVAHVRWEAEFKARGHRPDEVWIVFPGSFVPRSNPARWRVFKSEPHGRLVKQMMEAAQSVWKARGDGQQSQAETTLLARAEEVLAEINQVSVRLLPVHRLLRELFLKVPEDMLRRRKRYPDTAMEMLRWITRAVGHGVLDLGEIQMEIQQGLRELEKERL
jgi:hypothetical protein